MIGSVPGRMDGSEPRASNIQTFFVLERRADVPAADDDAGPCRGQRRYAGDVIDVVMREQDVAEVRVAKCGCDRLQMRRPADARVDQRRWRPGQEIRVV